MRQESHQFHAVSASAPEERYLAPTWDRQVVVVWVLYPVEVC